MNSGQLSPTADEVRPARKMEAAYRAAEARGVDAAQVDGVDVAVLRLVRNTIDKAELIGL